MSEQLSEPVDEFPDITAIVEGFLSTPSTSEEQANHTFEQIWSLAADHAFDEVNHASLIQRVAESSSRIAEKCGDQYPLCREKFQHKAGVLYSIADLLGNAPNPPIAGE
jgi:hypothetical protein